MYVNKSQINVITHENVLLIDDTLTIDNFKETILNQINDPRNIPSTQVTNTNINKNVMNYNHDYNKEDFRESDGDLINYQNQELKELEREFEMKKNLFKNEKIELEKKVLRSVIFRKKKKKRKRKKN